MDEALNMDVSDMSERSDKISFAQLFMMFALMNGLASHVIVNPMILDASGRDSWLAAAAAGGGFLLWIVPIWWIMRRTKQQEWRGWLLRRYHPIVGWLLLLPLGVHLYMIGGMTVIHTSTWQITNYLPTNPKVMLVVSLVAFCSVLSLWGLRCIAIASGVLLPIVVLLGFFVSFYNSPSKDYALLTPIMEHGPQPIIHGMVYAGAGFIELVALMAVQHRLKTKIKLWHLLAYGAFSTFITIGPLIGAITEFGPTEAAHQMISPYEQWRLVQIGQFIEHLDFLSIFQWLSGACVRTSLAVYLLLELMHLKGPKARYSIMLIIMASYIVIALLPIDEYAFYLWLLHYYMPFSLVILLIFSAAWIVAAWVGGNRRQEGIA